MGSSYGGGGFGGGGLGGVSKTYGGGSSLPLTGQLR